MIHVIAPSSIKAIKNASRFFNIFKIVLGNFQENVHTTDSFKVWFAVNVRSRARAKDDDNRPRGYKTFFTLTSVEHVIFHAHKCQNANKFMLINVEMPTIVGISTFMSREYSILGLSEPEKC